MTKRHMHAILALLLIMVFPQAGYSEPAAADWRFDTGLTLNRFEQQIKTEVGGVRGERLVEAFEFGFSGIATHRIWGPLSGGLYARYDIGTRKAGRFEGVENGRTVTAGETGGAYSELWFGPLVRAKWAYIFAELGYGLLGIRSDDARDDLPDEAGDTDNPLRTSKTGPATESWGRCAHQRDHQLGAPLRIPCPLLRPTGQATGRQACPWHAKFHLYRYRVDINKTECCQLYPFIDSNGNKHDLDCAIYLVF